MEFIENEKPGILVLVKCLDVIAPYLDKETQRKLKDPNVLHCKRFYYSRKLPIIIADFKKRNDTLQVMDHPTTESPVTINNIKTKLNKIYGRSFCDKKQQDLLINIAVPENEKVLINDFNKQKILNHHYRTLIAKSEEEILNHLLTVASHSDNYEKYFKNKLCKKVGAECTFADEVNRRKAEYYRRNYSHFVSMAESKYNRK
jgi:hypothetical protein